MTQNTIRETKNEQSKTGLAENLSPKNYMLQCQTFETLKCSSSSSSSSSSNSSSKVVVSKCYYNNEVLTLIYIVVVVVKYAK